MPRSHRLRSPRGTPLALTPRLVDSLTPGRRVWDARALAVLALALVVWARPDAGHAAIVKSVTSGSQLMPNSATPTNIALTGVDITKAFVVCTSRSTQSGDARKYLFLCDLNNNGAGGAAQLTITPTVAPGANAATVSYAVAEFSAGVSVQRGIVTFSDTTQTPDTAPTLSAVDCTKSFVLTSVRTTNNDNKNDEIATVRAILGTAASPCTTGTTTSLDLYRNLGRGGKVTTLAWQVVTMEGASVQRGTACIGDSAATPACPTATGATNGLNNRVTLGTAVDTTKSFVLPTGSGGTSDDGVEQRFLFRGEFLATGSSVTGVQFARSGTITGTNNQQIDIAYEVVSLSDGSTVQTSGTTPAAMTGTATTLTVTLPSLVDTTRTMLFTSTSGGNGGNNDYEDVTQTGVVNGTDGVSASSLTFTRAHNTDVGTISTAWFAVSFFRCNTASGTAYDTLCTVGASTTGTGATVHWSSLNTVVIARSTSTISVSPTNGTSPSVGSSLGAGVTVIYNGSAASDTSFAESGLTAGTTYYYKVWAKASTVGSCTASPCYVAGAEASVTPRTNANVWSSIVVGGAALNPAVAGTSRVSLGSNNGKLITLSSSTGAWSSVPAATTGAQQGYVSVFAYGAGEAVVSGDQSGWAYSINPATGAYNWLVKLNADAVQAPVTTFLRAYFTAGMTAAYPGTYDIIFVATMNNTSSGGYTNNKVFALRSDTGATLWTFSPATLSSGLCPSGCPMDQVLGQPWLDDLRARLYVTSRYGNGGGQNSIWVLDIVNSGALLATFAAGDITTGPSVYYSNDRLLVGDESGVLHTVDLAALTRTTNSIASGSAFRGIVWQDFNIADRLYFVTADGYLWCLPTPSSGSQCWTKLKPVSGGTISQILPGDTWIWAGGSDGSLYQINLATGLVDRSFAVGSGLGLGPVSTETADELYVAATNGKLYKITLTGGSLP